MNFANSNLLINRAEKVVPSLSQTFSKGPNQWARGSSPYYLESGNGAWVTDVDGNEFLDHLMALGPVILGYNDSGVNKAITAQLQKGIVFSQMHPLEVEVSELLVETIPCAEMVRFVKSGSDATTAAVRVARAFTGRDKVAICGYHGWQDWYVGTTVRNLGVPAAVKDLSFTFPYNDASTLRKLIEENSNNVAAIVLEAIGVIDPEDGFLEEVRDIATEHDIILIFDEVVTGFRMHLGGAQSYFGVTPDLACFGKAMANGMPLSAVVGKAPIMATFDKIFCSGTFGGETLSLAACKETVRRIKEENVIEHINQYGLALRNGINALIEKYQLSPWIKLIGQNSRSVMTFADVDEREARLRRTLTMQECAKRGLLYYCAHLPCQAHGEKELAFTLRVLGEVMPLLAQAIGSGNVGDYLEGPVVEAIFRKP